MINLLTACCLLFDVLQYSTSSTFKYRLTNSPDEWTYCSVNSSTSEVSYNSTLKVGEYYENGSYQNYYSVLKYTFPHHTFSSGSTASLTFNKVSGSASPIYFLYQVNDNGIDYSGWSYLGSANLTGNSYTISFSTIFSNAISNNKHTIYFLAYNNSSANATLAGDSSPNTGPTVTIITSETPGGTSYGCAPVYSVLNDTVSSWTGPHFNCLGYALGIKYVITMVDDSSFLSSITTNQEVEDDFLPYLVSRFKAYYDVNARIIDSYDSPIYPFERRIAVRKALSSVGFHFMRQFAGGIWAEKMGDAGITNCFDEGTTPDDAIWSSDYNSNTYYLAINNNGTSETYEQLPL